MELLGKILDFELFYYPGALLILFREIVDVYGLSLRRHRWTGRYEAHLWDNSCRKEGQTRKGRQGNKAGLR